MSSQVARRAQDPAERLVLAKANSRSTVYRASYLDYVSVKKLGGRPRRPARHRGVPVPRPVHARGAHRAHRRRARAPPQAGPGPGRGRAVQGRPRRQGPGRDPGGLPARGAVRDLGRGAHPDRARRAAAERAQADQAVPAPGPVRTVHVLPGLPAQGPVHHQGQAARAGHLAGGAARGLGGLQRHGRRLGPGPAVRGGQGRAGAVRAAGGRGRAGAEAGRGGQVVGRGSRRRGDPRARRGAGQRAGSPGCGASIPETYKADVTAADAVDDLPPCSSCASRGRNSRCGWSSTRAGGRSWCTGRAPRSRCPTCCRSCSTWGSRSSTSTRTRSRGAPAAGSFWIYEFGLRPPAAAASGSLQQVFEEALTALWHGETEDDGFNALVLMAGLTWREVTLLRACAKYLRQGGMRFSEDYVQRVLRSNAPITRLLIRLFESRFDPARQSGVGERGEAITEEIRGQLDEVTSLDADRILRSYLALIDATLRTNYYKQDSPGPGPGVDGPAAAGAQARPRHGPRDRGAAAQVRDLRLLAPAGGGAPALRPGGARRAALVGPARGLPHRGARPGQGAGGQERGHRPGRRQGRLRVQAAARPGRPRGVPGRGAGLLQDVHRGHARRDRQHRRRPGGAAARRGPPGRRRPVPGGRGGQGHRDVLRHGQRDRGAVRLLARRRVRLRRLRGLRPQEDGHHRARRLGVGEVALRRARAQPGHGRLHRGGRGRHVR